MIKKYPNDPAATLGTFSIQNSKFKTQKKRVKNDEYQKEPVAGLIWECKDNGKDGIGEKNI